MTLRAQVKYEECPTNDYLEQWDTPEKYYGCAPKCRHGTEMSYDSDHKWSSDCYLCEDGEEDEHGVLVAREESVSYIDNPEVFKAGEGMCGVMVTDGVQLPFEEYAKTYGDSNRYVYLYALIELQCEHCNEWSVKDSLSGIDIYEHGSDSWETGTFTESEVDKMPKGHLRETLQDMFSNVKAEAA